MNRLTWVMILAVALGSAGCDWKKMQMAGLSNGKPVENKQPAPEPTPSAPSPVAPKVSEGPSPVEQALELSRQLKKAQEDLDRVRQENEDLAGQNTKLASQAAQATTELDQAQRELADANDMLREMKVELSNWKANVMGFREEMRTAQVAQIDGLRRILKLLGADEAPVISAPTTKPAVGANGAGR